MMKGYLTTKTQMLWIHKTQKTSITYLMLINDGAMGYATLVAHIFKYIYAKL
jgi:hypothetical protein